MRLSRGDSAVIWKVLHPSTETKLTRAADRPLILAGEVNGWRILNLSGLGEKGVQELLERESAIMADIVITGAAAGSVRSASELVKKSKPSVVIFGPAQFQAKVSDADLKALKSNAPNVISLDREGAVTINLRKSLCEIETASGMKIELRK